MKFEDNLFFILIDKICGNLAVFQPSCTFHYYKEEFEHLPNTTRLFRKETNIGALEFLYNLYMCSVS